MPSEPNSGDPIAELKAKFAARGAATAEPAAEVAPAPEPIAAAGASNMEKGIEEEVAEDEGEEKPKEAEPKAKAEKEPKPKRDWRDIKAGKDYAKRKEAEEDAAAARQLSQNQAAQITALQEAIAALQRGETVDPDKTRPAAKTEAQIRSEAVEEAKKALRAESEINEFVTRADRLLDQGVETFGKAEFEEARNNIIGFGSDLGMFTTNESRVEFIQQVLDSTDKPERVIFMMGQDPDEAERIIALPERKRIAAMVLMANSRPRKTPISEAPKPPEPVQGNGVLPIEYRGADKTPSAAKEKFFADAMERMRQRRHG